MGTPFAMADHVFALPRTINSLYTQITDGPARILLARPIAISISDCVEGIVARARILERLVEVTHFCSTIFVTKKSLIFPEIVFIDFNLCQKSHRPVSAQEL